MMCRDRLDRRPSLLIGNFPTLHTFVYQSMALVVRFSPLVALPSPAFAQVPPLREDPLYQTFDHLMQDFYAQQELESATKVGQNCTSVVSLPSSSSSSWSSSSLSSSSFRSMKKTRLGVRRTHVVGYSRVLDFPRGQSYNSCLWTCAVFKNDGSAYIYIYIAILKSRPAHLSQPC